MQWQYIDVKQFFIAAFVVYFFKTIMKYWKKYCFLMPSRKMIWAPRFTLTDECAQLRVRYKTMTVWNMRLVYIYILYPLETTSFVMVGSSFPKDNHSLSKKHTHTYIQACTLKNWWQTAQPELSFQSTFTVW